MASNTTPRRNVLAVAVTALLVTSAVAAGVSLTAVGTASAAPTGIDECTTIDESGVYELTNDIANERESCLTITASDVTVDGDGHEIGRTSVDAFDPAIIVGGADPVDNVTVTEATVLIGAPDFAFPDGIVFENAHDSSLLDVRIESNAMPEIKVEGDDNTFRNVSAARYGATFEVTGNDTLIADTVNDGAGESAAFYIEGDGTVLRNVTGDGTNAGTLVGDDVVVENSTFDWVSYGLGLSVVDSRNATVVDNEFRDVNEEASLYLENSNSAEVRGNTAPGGIALTGSDDNTIRGNVMGAISVGSGSESNLIYDNRIVSVDVDGDAGSNTWNVTPRAGESVIGGDTVAGNYYANADGTGFSQICADADGDGLCDSANEFDGSNTDYAPLAGLTPVVGGQSPTDPDGDGLYEDVNGDGEFAYNDVIAFFEHFRDAAVQDNEMAYDFDGADGVTYSDLVALFEEI